MTNAGTTFPRAWLAIGAVCLATACGDDGDARVPAGDGGSLTDVRDSGVREEIREPVPCAVDDAGEPTSTVGCNGGFQGVPGVNEPGGRCEPGTDEERAGSCTTDRAICMGDSAGSGQGWCVIGCPPPIARIDAQTCPRGYRCFRHREGEDAFGLCYRDCDAEHPCQEGWTCNDALGRCEEVPPS